MPPSDPGEPATALDVLVVASWFPAYDDPAAGRFVADQVEALATTGAARIRVVSFDPARLAGGSMARQHQADAVLAASAAALDSAEPLFLAPAWGVDRRVPVTRLSIPDGRTSASGVEHLVVHRESALRALAGRLSATASAGALGVVHAHTVYPDGAAAAVLAERLGWPLLITEHSSFVDEIIAVPARRARYEAALSRSHVVHAVSEMLAGELRTRFPNHAAKVQVMPNAVPLGLFHPATLDARVADQLLFVGRRKATKGIEVLLRAVAIARSRRKTITLRLLGRAPDDATEARWRALSAELGLGSAVSFEDGVDRPTIAAAMAGASVFVHPSPRETFGVVAVEALASGTPIVATDSGGVTEIMGPEPDRLGAIVAPDDPDALAAAILATLDRRSTFDPAILRESVERRFGAEFVAERLLVAYREAAGSFRASGRELTRSPGGRTAIDPTPASSGRRTIVVALDREAAVRRLSPLPRPLLAETILVTASDGAAQPTDRVALSIARIVEVELPGVTGVGARRATRGRAARLLADPRESVRRILGRGVGSRRWVKPVTNALAGLAREFDGDGSTTVAEIVAVDGADHLAVAPLVRAGRVSLFPGGLRRLADRWLAGQATSEGREP